MEEEDKKEWIDSHKELEQKYVQIYKSSIIH